MPSPQKVKGKSFENAKAKFLTEIFGEKLGLAGPDSFLEGEGWSIMNVPVLSQNQGPIFWRTILGSASFDPSL